MGKNYKTILFVALTAFILSIYQPLEAGAKKFDNGIKAPSWGNTRWINLPPGKTGLDIGDYRGKVVYLAFFQKW